MARVFIVSELCIFLVVVVAKQHTRNAYALVLHHWHHLISAL